MTKIFLGVAFCISVFTLPWWVTALCGIFFLADGGSPLLVIAGGFILDELFGAPVQSLGGFAWLYTLLFGCLSFCAWYLRKEIFE